MVKMNLKRCNILRNLLEAVLNDSFEVKKNLAYSILDCRMDNVVLEA
jgi:hypothetical protein